MVVVFVLGVSLIFLGGQVAVVDPAVTHPMVADPAKAHPPVADPAVAVPACVIVMDVPGNHLEAYVPGVSVTLCQDTLAEFRRTFGPDSATRTLHVSTIRPLGTPDCVVDGAQVHISGSEAANLKAQVCSRTGS